MINERLRIAEVLKKCAKHGLIDEGRQAHAAAFRNGYYWLDVKISNDIIHMYSKCGRMDLACQVFDGMPKRSVVSWTLLICGHLQQRKPTESLLLLRRMHCSEERPNEFTFSTSFKACGLLCLPENGMQIHGLCIRTGFDVFSEVGNSMIDMYSRCGRIKDSERSFNVMPVRTVVSWNAMIAGYASEEMGDKALDLFRKMQEEGEEIPDEFTFTSSLRACNCIGGIRQGSQIHAYLIKRWFNVPVHEITSGALVDLYVKTGYLSNAHQVFDEIREKNIVLWSTLIQGYAQQRSLEEAMNLFRKLRESSSVKVDGFTLSSMIGIFADFALAEQGRQMHSYAMKVPSGLWISVSNSIVDMYMKCGLLDEAEKHFNEMEEKNLISWTVMITGYGKYGLGRKAILLFEKMMLNGIEPDRVTYLALLSACSHSGLIEEGKKYFSEILDKEQEMKLGMEHYGSLVDLLGRGGRLEEAKKLIIENVSLRSEVGLWQSLLSACRVHRNVEMAKEVGETLLRLDNDNPVNYVMLSNVYADFGLWEESERLRGLARMNGLKKEIGRSWVEIDKVVQFFCSGDETHPLTEEIHSFLREMETRLKEEVGYSKEVTFALYDVEEESKVETLRFHSEKLAIGLALIQNKKGVIRVFKNLRVCGDCHEFIKGLSKILTTVLLVRDASRFHKFEDGKCSCGDYW